MKRRGRSAREDHRLAGAWHPWQLLRRMLLTCISLQFWASCFSCISLQLLVQLCRALRASCSRCSFAACRRTVSCTPT